MGAFVRLEDVDELADQGPKATHGSFFCLSQHGFEFGKGLFDRIEVGAVWRQEPESCARRLDPFAH